MKRTIAILLCVLVLAFCFAACGRKDEGNVSETTNGTVSDTQRSTTNTERNSKENTSHNNNNRSGRNNDDMQSDKGLMDDMENAMVSVGDAIKDTGRAVGDAVTGTTDTPATGMTGGR